MGQMSFGKEGSASSSCCHGLSIGPMRSQTMQMRISADASRHGSKELEMGEAEDSSVTGGLLLAVGVPATWRRGI